MKTTPKVMMSVFWTGKVGKLESKSLAKITELVKDEIRAESRQGH